jgi:large subunit ribosomal protein L4
MTQELLSITGEPKGTIELPDVVFGEKVRKDLLWDSVNVYLTNQRQGNANTKTRAEVSGGGKKPWRQKHTGRARAGSTRSPIWRHGGIVFGPRTREYGLSIPVQKRAKALRVALSSARSENRVRVVEDFDLPTAKTKELYKILTGLGALEHSALLVVDKTTPNLKLAARNIPNLDLMRAQDLNAYAVMVHKMVVITRSAIAAIRTPETTEPPANAAVDVKE